MTPSPWRLLKQVLLLCAMSLAGGVVPACDRNAPQPAQSQGEKLARPLTSRPAGRPKEIQIRQARLIAGQVERSGFHLNRGEEVVLRFTVAGLRHRGRKLRISAQLRLLDASGQVVLAPPPLRASRTVPSGHATDVVVLALRFRVPPLARPGPAQIQLSVRDRVGQLVVSRRLSARIHGPSVPEGGRLRVASWRLPAPEDLRAGLPWVADLEVAGLQPDARSAPASARPPGTRESRRRTGGKHHVRLVGRAELRNGHGRVVARSQDTLVQAAPSFRVHQAALRWAVPLPATLAPGDYRLRLSLQDPLSGARTVAEHPVRLLPGGLGLYAVRLLGQGVPRDSFGRGETMTVQFAVAGWQRTTQLALGVGLVGPDHGIYFLRKQAHVLQVSQEDRQPRVLRVPLQIPEFVPTGRWTLQLRVVNASGGAQATRAIPFRVVGEPLPPLHRLAVRHLALYHPDDPLPVPGVFLHSGSHLRLTFVVGGMHLTPERSYYHRVRLRCAVRLRDRTGHLVARKEPACALDRRFSFQPRRLRLSAEFQIPPTALGVHQLEVEVLDLASNHVGLVVRRLFLLARHPRPDPRRAGQPRDK